MAWQELLMREGRVGFPVTAHPLVHFLTAVANPDLRRPDAYVGQVGFPVMAHPFVHLLMTAKKIQTRVGWVHMRGRGGRLPHTPAALSRCCWANTQTIGKA